MGIETQPVIVITVTGSKARASVTCAMLSSRMQMAIRLPMDEGASQSYDELTTEGRKLVYLLDQIEGMTSFKPADAYSCDLEKADAYDWEELVLEVQLAMADIYNEVKGTFIPLNDFLLLTHGLSR